MPDKDKLRIALAEQHRNTRHDAIDKIIEIIFKRQQDLSIEIPDYIIEEITVAIMNLKQRPPRI